MRARTRAAARSWLESARFEVLPTARIVDEVSTHLQPGATVTVTASPSKGLGATLDCAEELAGRGFDVVPHLAARMVAGRSELEEICARLRECGVSSVFVPAGDADPAPGGYHGAVELLADLEAMGSPFAQVGITGYPESHPRIGDDVTVQAMWDKRHHATQIVSNLVFDPKVVAGWIERVRARGVRTPILIGLVGPVDRGPLLKMATKIGVGESTKFLVKNRNLFTRIVSPGGYDPMRFLAAVAAAAPGPEAGVAGLHLFTFNQVAETEAWRRVQVERLGTPAGSTAR
ncbi:methylenetetrahydrofolate reductase [Nocardioides ultimimeridianus]